MMKLWTSLSYSILLWTLSPNPTLAQPYSPRRGIGDELPLRSFAVGWLDNKSTFQAGDIAIIKIKPFDNPFNNSNSNPDKYATRFSLSVSGKNGNNSYVSGVVAYTEGDASYWNVSFIPIRVGNFNVVVAEEHSGIADSSLHFSIIAGRIYPSACVASWLNSVNEFVAGTRAYISIFPRDAFGNKISSATDGLSKDYFMVSATFENGSVANVLDVRYNGWNELGCIGVEFVPTTAGSLLLHVFGDNRTLSGSPLPFVVRPGSLNITNSLAKWKYETNSLQIFSKLEIFIYQRDQYGNLVPGLHPFDTEVVEKATDLSIPIADLFFQEVAQGIQLASFIALEPGDFLLTISSAKLNDSIANMPFHYTVFTGYCNSSCSIVNGSGLFGSVVGKISYFAVYLKDMYNNPCPIEAQRLHIQILSKDGLFSIHPVIFPLGNSSEHGPVARKLSSAKGDAGTIPAEKASENSTYIGNSSVQASDFNVAYTPEKSGAYEVRVFCGNILLNYGRSYLMKVSPGVVDPSLSSVVKYAPRVKRLVKNEVLVQLMDSFSNPTPSHQIKLSFHFDATNSSGISSWPFVDNEDGSYIGYYLARDLGAYNICILFEDKHLSPCPFEINVYDRNYFPEAYNDSVSVWEDESNAFNVLSNDYYAGGQASIIASSIPIHGSLLQYGQLFRYTPYKGFFGDDSFSYTIADKNENVATGTAFISVLCRPPQFLSLPVRLHVAQDIISPKFGGFPGFEIEYSDSTENISVTIRARYGSIFLAPTPVELWQPLGSRLSVNKGGRAGKDLILAGYVEFINSALQLIQYLGNENFYGSDTISLHAMNRNGIQDAHVPVFVEPTNDPPTIYAPKFIILGTKESSHSSQIFDKQRDVFEFSIADPDLYNFPDIHWKMNSSNNVNDKNLLDLQDAQLQGVSSYVNSRNNGLFPVHMKSLFSPSVNYSNFICNRSHFVVIFSLEVNDGIISTTLPAYLSKTAEVKIKNSNLWRPLQTFVSISNHFALKGRGIRFRGTIGDCNNAMQRLFYEGSNDDAVLTIHVNDIGNYGCYPDCKEMKTVPLSTEISVNLMSRKPISSMTALLLGSAIIIEIFMMLLLGGVLLFFMCKCMNVLHKEKRDCTYSTKLPAVDNLKKRTRNFESSRNVTYLDGRCSSFPQRSQFSNFRQRSCRVRKHEETGQSELPSSSRVFGDGHELLPLSIGKC